MLTHEAACTSEQVSVHCQGLTSTLHVKHIKPPKARQERLQCSGGGRTAAQTVCRDSRACGAQQQRHAAAMSNVQV